ncbi:hypothetical protein HHK36_003126 [Tetracentron sinense]|uniref:TF-B3 domain-containing protein n=1 Tax=Tetracentron sinense TaxID=13715 RepID=A0A834ZMN4_TETSI|nr:hypothetical protein HHK36_003126 [Tetracentron sinense]
MPRLRRRREEGSSDWPNIPEKRSHFFRIIGPADIRDKHLGIPRKFVGKFGVELSDVAFLKVPSGTVWSLGLRKADDKVWFQNGWQEFVEHYSIRDGHFLVFRYDGNSHFSVLIFDMSASEIMYPPETENFEEPNNDRGCQVPRKEESEEEEDSLEILDVFPQFPIPSRKVIMTKFEDHLTTKRGIGFVCPEKRTGSISEKDNTNNLRSSVPSVQHIGVQVNEIELTKSKVDGVDSHFLIQESRGHSFSMEQEENESLPATIRCPHSEILVERRPVKFQERYRALQAARAFESTNPFFMVIMQPSYLLTEVYVPSFFSKKYLKAKHVNATLRVSDGRTWAVHYSFQETRGRLYRGWKAFVLDNYLREGDVCVFELVKKNDIELKVVIFRGIEDVACH